MTKWRKLISTALLIVVVLLCRQLFNRGADLMAVGKFAYGRRDYAKARDDFKRAIALQSTANRHGYLALAYWKLGDLEAAQTEGEIGTHLAPDSVVGHDNLSLIYTSAKRFAKAKHEADIATRLDPGNIDAWYALVIAAASSADYEGAADACRHAISARPSDERSHFLYAYALDKSGRTSEALEEWKYVAQHSTRYRSAASSRLNNPGADWTRLPQ